MTRKYILSLDGGGFRGLACLLILKHVMRMFVDDPDEDPVPSPCEIFDMICGTSTGGIIALLLGRLGLDCTTAINIYKELGRKAFGNDAGKMWGIILAGERFSSAEFETFLAKIVKEHTGDEKTALKKKKSTPDATGNRNTDIFVTVVPEGTGSAGVDAYRLRSYATPLGGTDSAPDSHTWTILEAARAISATPMYFSPLKLGSQGFQDAGASGFNNPTMVALEEAELRWPHAELVVVSLGTGLASLLPDLQIINEAHSAGTKRVAQKLLGMVKNMVTAPSRLEQVAEQLLAVATDTELRHLDAANQFNQWNRRDDYFRFNPPQGLGDLDMADYMQEEMIVEITNVWLRSPAGKKSTLAAYDKLEPAYEARRNSY